MKKLKLIFTIAILTAFVYSCNNSAVQRMMEEPVEPERSVGFNDWSDDGKEYKFHLGTEASIDIVKEFDKMSGEKNYDGMNEIFSDTTVITYQNGQKASIQDFISMNIRRDSMLEANDAKLNWDLLRAFSVDIDPTRGGEHVNAMYMGKYEDSEGVNTFYANLWFYIIDGKIITVNQYNQDVVDEQPESSE